MKFIMKHFPFLFLLVVLFSCNSKEDKNIVNNYKESLGKAITYRDTIVNLDSAYYYFNKAKLTCNEKQADRIVYLLAEMAKIQKIRGDYSGSEATATEAFDYFNSVKDSAYIYSIYSTLGTSYQKLFDYEKAIKYYNLCLKGSVAEIDKQTMMNNIAVVYMDNDNFPKAIETLQPLIRSEILKDNGIEYARISDNLGFSYFKVNRSSIAKVFLEISLKIRDSLADNTQKIASYVHLSEYYEIENPVLAKEYAQKALQSSIIVNSPDDKMESLKLLINLSEPLKSKEYFNDYIKINDSISNARQIAKNQFANIKYESSLAIKDAENQKNQKIIYLLLLVVSTLIALFIIYYIRKKNKEKLKANTYETETRISKKLHDELANDVFNTITFIESQDLQNPVNKETILQGLDTIYSKARNISQQNSSVKTGKEFGDLLNEMLSSYKSEEVNIIKKGINTINWELIAIEKQIQIHRVLQEVLVNMKKHSQASHVAIIFETLEKSIRIRYSDNGVGFDKERKTKSGLNNMESRMISIKGSITFESEINKGVKITIEFPK